MSVNMDYFIMAAAALVTLILLIFTVDWRYFGEWVVVFLLKAIIDVFGGAVVVELKYLEYPVRLLPRIFETSLLFEFWVFPVLCVLYNQVTRNKGLWPIFYQAVLFSAGITAVEYPLELFTNLIKYINWSWFHSLAALTATFLFSRVFMAFYRWGCAYFGGGRPYRY